MHATDLLTVSAARLERRGRAALAQLVRRRGGERGGVLRTTGRMLLGTVLSAPSVQVLLGVGVGGGAAAQHGVVVLVHGRQLHVRVVVDVAAQVEEVLRGAGDFALGRGRRHGRAQPRVRALGHSADFLRVQVADLLLAREVVEPVLLFHQRVVPIVDAAARRRVRRGARVAPLHRQV